MDTTLALKRPIISEKSTLLSGENKYLFEVARTANKMEIKKAVETNFKVNVTAVNVITIPGKMRKVGKSRGMTSPYKKAVVTLRPGERIEILEGV